MKTYQKPTISNIPLEASSVANMQGTTICINRDARASVDASDSRSMPCGSTDNPFGLTASAVTGCDGQTIFPDPTIITAIALNTPDIEAQLNLKGFAFPTLDPLAGSPPVDGCAGSGCTP